MLISGSAGLGRGHIPVIPYWSCGPDLSKPHE